MFIITCFSFLTILTLFDIYMFQQLLVTNTSRKIMTGVYLLTLTFLFMKTYQGQFENDMESHIFFETTVSKRRFLKMSS